MTQTQPMAARMGRDGALAVGGQNAWAEARPVARTQAAVGLALVEAVIGYEWVLSGMNKILSPVFRSGLPQQVKMAFAGNPNTWWVALARSLVLPHTQLFATLVEAGELLVGLGCFAGALLWASGRFPSHRWTRLLNVVVIGALIGSASMTANYYVMSGATVPLLDPSNPFNEGIGIDGLLTFIALGLLAVHVAPFWPRPGRPTGGELKDRKR